MTMHYRVGQKLVLFMSQLFFKEQSVFMLLSNINKCFFIYRIKLIIMIA